MDANIEDLNLQIERLRLLQDAQTRSISVILRDDEHESSALPASENQIGAHFSLSIRYHFEKQSRH